MKRLTILSTILLWVGVLIAPTAFGHALDQGYIFLNIEGDRVRGRVEMTLRDVNRALDLDLATREATLADIEPHRPLLDQYVAGRVGLSIADGRLAFDELSVFDAIGERFVQLHFVVDELAEEPEVIDVEYAILFDRQPAHRGMLVIESNWKTGTFDNEANVSLIFEPGRERQTLDLSSSSTLRGFIAMVGLGTHHIWIGIDHILFLLALLLPAVVTRRDGRWQPVEGFRPAIIHVVKVVTIFTVAHTITLSLAALNAVTLPARLVESIIAISIAIAALDIFYPIFRQRIWWIVFIFGLFHGFGFASVLGEIGIPPAYVVHSLLGFNVGVELGQLAVVAALFPVLYLLRNFSAYTRVMLPAAAAILVAVSLYWFTERAFLIDLPAGAIVNSMIALVM